MSDPPQHIPPALKRTPNRLAAESSPYLLQHAGNPVNWFPWGSEAFETARAAGKPIFLSIGYSTCYWCHVMERECFENDPIATLMNDLFVCIKVDREQRPDVDDVYMTAVQLMTGSGGWPMSVFLEPATLKPFFGGTYFPPEDRYGRPGFPAVLSGVADVWRNRRGEVLEQAERIAAAIEQHHAIEKHAVALDRSHIGLAVSGLMSVYDSVDGGFGGGRSGPKFPQPANLEMLMAVAWNQPLVRRAVLHTLDRMAMGGMYDQVGGGFHRYSVDCRWQVPHFEKMLYDNAQLASIYVRAFELTHESFYAHVVDETLEYVRREMTSTDAAFLSAQDAEVHSFEGANYVWTESQIRAALTLGGESDLVDFTLEVLGVQQGPNFRDPHHAEAGPTSVLFLPQRPDQLAQSMRMSIEAFRERLNRAKRALLATRNRRDQPLKDDKILAAWNGLMIVAFADAGRILKRPDLTSAASAAADFVLAHMYSTKHGLWRAYRGGIHQIDGFLEDYACVIRGLIALHHATKEPRWLATAIQLSHEADSRFWDEIHGGWFDTRAEQRELFVRIKSVHDGAVPSGNSVMMLNLLDLHALTGDANWFAKAQEAMRGLSGTVAQHPSGCVLSIVALERLGSASHADGTEQLADVVVVAVEPKVLDWESGDRVEITVQLTIQSPWHIAAARPGVDWAVPFSIELVGCEGIQASPCYPEGDAFTVEGMPSIRVMSGSVTIPVEFKRVGRVEGIPRLEIAYQACDDRSCRAPQRMAITLTP